MPQIKFLDPEQQTPQVSSYNWKTWSKAGLVFAGTVGVIFAAKTYGSFDIANSWLKRVKASYPEDGLELFHDDKSVKKLSLRPVDEFVAIENSIKSRLTEFDELAIVTNNVKFVGRNLLQASDSSEVNALPVLVNNELTIKVGESKVLTSAELSATDIDTDNNTLVFTANELQHGDFRYANGTTVISWTQQELISGSIHFSHDSSFIAPTYSVKVSDGISDTECNRPIVSFAAENAPITDEFQVNTYTVGGQTEPLVASFSDNRFVVTWFSYGQDGDSYGIYGQLFNIDGSKNGLEFQVNTYTTSGQMSPSVASFSDDRFVVSWMSDGQDGDSYGIYAQLFNANSSKSGLEFRVNTYTTNVQGYPSVARFSNNRFVVSWMSDGQDGDGRGVYGQLFNADGSKNGIEFQVNTYTMSDQWILQVASFSDSRFVVTWISQVQDGDSLGIYGQLFNANGSKSGLEFQVNTYTTSLQSMPSIASFNDDRFVVTWVSDGQDGDVYGIFGQLFNNDGNKSGSEFQVNTYTTSWQQSPWVASFSDDRFVVTWGSKGQDGSDWGIYGQLFNNDSSKSGLEFPVNTYTTNGQLGQSVASFSNGRFVVTWVSLDQDGDSAGVYAKIFGPNICPFLTNNYLAINEGAILQLDTINFNVTDPDSNYNSTLYTFTDIQNGQFELIAMPGTNITSCTQQQITAGEIQFVHDGGEQTPTCQIMVSDDILSTSFIPVTISFTNVNDAPILGNNTLSINEDETVIPTTTNLSATDVDNDDNTLEFTVSNVQYGQFELVNNPGVPITSFTQQQIILSQVRFIHDGGEIAPSYDIVVSDGDLATTAESSMIVFTNVNDMPLLINNTLSITTGQTLRLSSTNLSATDTDNDANTLEFTVSDVQHGQFELFVRPGMAITSFTQQQIINGDICFVHDGGLDAPSYKVSVSDGELTTPPSVALINFVDISESSTADSRVSSAMVNSLQSSSETRKSELYSKISSFTPMSSNSIVKPSSLVSIPSSVDLPLSGSSESTLKDNTLVIILAVVFGSGGALTCAILSGLGYLWYRRSREEHELPGIELRAVRVESKHMSMLDKKGELQVSFNIPYGKLKFGKVLGGGGSGVVYQGVWQRTHVAIKKLPLAGLDDTTQREFVQETSIMANLRHPNIVQLFGVCLKPECCIVMEYMVGGSLYDFLHSDKQLEWNLKWKIALDIGQGLAYLHEENILHRDLKSLNVLLDQDKRAKLTDFGLSKVDAESIKTMTQEGQGTPRWLPPEVMETGQEGEEKSHYIKKSDVYSYGIILWELATREIPFDDIENNFVVMQKVKQGQRPKDPADCSPTYTALMKRCWADRTLDRPDIDEAVQILETHRNEFLAGDITSQTVSMV